MRLPFESLRDDEEKLSPKIARFLEEAEVEFNRAVMSLISPTSTDLF